MNMKPVKFSASKLFTVLGTVTNKYTMYARSRTNVIHHVSPIMYSDLKFGWFLYLVFYLFNSVSSSFGCISITFLDSHIF